MNAGTPRPAAISNVLRCRARSSARSGAAMLSAGSSEGVWISGAVEEPGEGGLPNLGTGIWLATFCGIMTVPSMVTGQFMPSAGAPPLGPKVG